MTDSAKVAAPTERYLYLGLDASTTHIGWGLLRHSAQLGRELYVASGVVASTKKRKADRLPHLMDQLEATLAIYVPYLLAICAEQPAAGDYPGPAGAYGLMGVGPCFVWAGRVVDASNVYDPNPQQVKAVLAANGAAGKDQMNAAATDLYGRQAAAYKGLPAGAQHIWNAAGGDEADGLGCARYAYYKKHDPVTLELIMQTTGVGRVLAGLAARSKARAKPPRNNGQLAFTRSGQPLGRLPLKVRPLALDKCKDVWYNCRQ